MSVKTILATEGVATGPVGTRASAASFGAQGVGAVGQGFQQLSRGLEQYDEEMTKVDMHLKRLDDAKWHNESQKRIQEASTNFLSNPENANKDTFHQDYKSYMETIAKDFQKAAPSPEAANQIDSSITSIFSDGYRQAIHKVVQDKVTSSMQSANDLVNTAAAAHLSVIQSGATQDIVDSSRSSLLETYDKTQTDIRNGIGKWGKAIASKALSNNASDTVLMVGVKDPAFARQLLNKASLEGDLDGRSVAQLSHHLTLLEEQRAAAVRPLFQDQVNAERYAAENGMFSKTPLTLQQFESVMPPAQAKTQYELHRNAMDSLQRVWETDYPMIRGWNPQAQMAHLEKVKKDALSGGDHVAASTLQQLLVKNNALRQQDPVEWMKQNNPVVSSLQLAATREGLTDNDRRQLITEMNDAILDYEGPPPSDAKKELLPLYQNSLHPMALLSAKQATDLVKEIKETDSSEKVLGIFTNLAQNQFPNPKHFQIAMADLKEHGLSVDGQLIAQNIGQPSVNGLVRGLMQTAPELDQLKTEQKTALEKAVRTAVDPWVLGFGPERLRDASATRDSILKYASYRLATGASKSPTEAAKSAVDIALGSTLSLQKIKGSDAIIPREVLGQKIDEGALANIPYVAESALEHLDTSQMQVERWFPRLTMLQDQGARESEALKMLNQYGRFELNKSGTALQLRIPDDNGHLFTPLDKNNRPFELSIVDDLAQYAKVLGPDLLQSLAISPTGSVGYYGAPQVPMERPKIVPHFSSEDTNWPVR